MADAEIHFEGLDEFERWLGGLDDRVDAWLHDAVDDAARYGGEQLIAHAPGGIKELVGTDLARPVVEGSIVTAEAFVDPATTDAPRTGPGSNPADYPFFVDVGTGVFGETGAPVTSFPGGVMGPILFGGRMIYIRSFEGQPAQHYSDEAARDVDAFLDFRILAHSGKMVAGP